MSAWSFLDAGAFISDLQSGLLVSQGYMIHAIETLTGVQTLKCLIQCYGFT